MDRSIVRTLTLVALLLFTGGCATTKIMSAADQKNVCSNPTELNEKHFFSKALGDSFHERFKSKEKRKIAVFLDGTGNTNLTSTNIWKMYQLSVEHACAGEPVIPYYIQGVGTKPYWYDTILGGAFGRGLGKKIKKGYQFLAEHYQEGDEIFIFGFSRGAYSARSLNGLIEFANLIDLRKIEKGDLQKEVKGIYKAYNTLNDGRPDFEDRLRRNIKQLYSSKVHDKKIVVTAIGVYDTVAALGLVRDDFPDDHRTNLYANQGYHALSLDEQRDDFRLLRFDDYNIDSSRLKEVWFPGVHADVGGGYDDSNDLDSISRRWMLKGFAQYNLFKSKQSTIECMQAETCYAGKLHDAFFDDKLFGRLGISRRRPRLQDSVHQSVICRMNISTLPEPHQQRETITIAKPEKKIEKYMPFNLSFPVKESYVIEDADSYRCAYGKGK